MQMKRPAVADLNLSEDRVISGVGSGDNAMAGSKRRRLSILVAASGLANLAKLDQSESNQPQTSLADKTQCRGQIPSEKEYWEAKGKAAAVSSKRTFPQVLMSALVSNEAADMIQWRQDGNAFVIRKPQEFASKVLPKFFKKTQFESFVRKLKRWGFRRVQWGPDSGAFYHPLFRRKSPELCVGITCKITEPKPAATSTNKNPFVDLKQLSALCDSDTKKHVDSQVGRPTKNTVVSKNKLYSQQGMFPFRTEKDVVSSLKAAQCSGLLSHNFNIRPFDPLALLSSPQPKSNVSHQLSLLKNLSAAPSLSRNYLNPSDVLLAESVLKGLKTEQPQDIVKNLSAAPSLPRNYPNPLNALLAESVLKGLKTERPQENVFSAMQLRHCLLLKQTQLSRELLRKSGSLCKFSANMA